MIQFTRLAEWFKSFVTPSITPAAESTSLLEIDPSWHGDHWQNLLASPMDARRYVMEDWATPLQGDVVATDEASQPDEVTS